jgi:hypothetical protein
MLLEKIVKEPMLSKIVDDKEGWEIKMGARQSKVYESSKAYA